MDAFCLVLRHVSFSTGEYGMADAVDLMRVLGLRGRSGMIASLYAVIYEA